LHASRCRALWCLDRSVLLSIAPKSGVKIFCGKTSRERHYPNLSKTRNQLGVSLAKSMTCGPMKGGDTTWAWRAEEIRVQIEAFGIRYTWSRELPSAIAVPASAGIRWPKAGVREFLWWLAATSGVILSTQICFRSGTKYLRRVVILMGKKSLPEIVAIYEKLVGKILRNCHYRKKWSTRGGAEISVRQVTFVLIFLKKALSNKSSRARGNHHYWWSVRESWVGRRFTGGSKSPTFEVSISNEGEFEISSKVSNYRSFKL